MRPKGPTFWLLDEATGWRTAFADGVVEDERAGLRLEADPDGPRSLHSPDGSLGGLVLPSYLAVDGDDRLFLLTDGAPHLRLLDAETGRFEPLAATGAAGRGARDLDHPVAIAANGRNLLVADRRKVAVFDTATLALRAVWGPRPGWRPASVAAGPTGGYVLDAANGAVYRYQDAFGTPAVVFPEGGGPWDRLAVDDSGRLYLRADAEHRLDVFAPDGRLLRSVADGGQVADAFPPPRLTADHRRRFRVPAGLLCDLPAAWYDPATGGPAEFRDDEWVGPAPYRTAGTWIGGPLDSEIYRCQWHRIELDPLMVPAGARVRISTYTDADELAIADVLAVPEAQWGRLPALVGPLEPPDEGDGAVLSREGRYVWVRLELAADGYATPSVGALRAHYPRRSPLRLLPAVYSADDAARRFLDRFLSMFDTNLEPDEQIIRDYPALFDPDAAPPKMVDRLSTWLALPLEGAWRADQRRNLLRAIPGILTSRGTPEALRRYVRAYLENVAGTEIAPDGFPHVVEGYRERNHVWLDTGERVGGRVRLWGPGKVARLQVDRYATEGQVRLVTTGDPDRDVFHHYAHRFRVVVPAPWVRTATDERMVRRAIEAEKPAHTAYELALLTPGITLGRQSTVGLDTVVGAIPKARLACRHDTDAAPSRPPTGRLGVDTVLCGGRGRPRDLRLRARVGANATLL